MLEVCSGDLRGRETVRPARPACATVHVAADYRLWAPIGPPRSTPKKKSTRS